jgi:hypothetical protein
VKRASLAADLLSAGTSNHTGEFLATGDASGRIVLLQQIEDSNMLSSYLDLCFLRWDTIVSHFSHCENSELSSMSDASFMQANQQQRPDTPEWEMLAPNGILICPSCMPISHT